MPNQVKTVRVLMFVAAGLTLVMTLAFFAAVGVTAAAIGAALWFALPGALSLLLALRVPNGGTGLRRGIIALEVFYILLSLARLGQGDPRGVLNLALPIVILVLLFRPEAKAYFGGRATAAGSYF
ncbi:hypothetical protein BKA00_006681 [Actinomadura coerulea]|uniref:DUF2568 domain-containing protein n=1 Tax=Actinomadura coerulea TaxID=46159 RepID=A0A7X0L2Q6_9ACTN|nr:hypothetical protein [Actinomadura coerulea]MBB6399767.1 hypothetical protein [Actinomadura coerulea]GGQ15805.1 hypothetical protein GCM10010187_35000 [Actinomadura coerulea]